MKLDSQLFSLYPGFLIYITMSVYHKVNGCHGIMYKFHVTDIIVIDVFTSDIEIHQLEYI